MSWSLVPKVVWNEALQMVSILLLESQQTFYVESTNKPIVYMYIEELPKLVNANIYKFFKNVENGGMAVPKPTETRCRDGSVQARHAIKD